MSRSSRDFDSCESSQVTMRNHTPGLKEKKGKKGNRILTKADISGPRNFKHIGEIKTYNYLTAFIDLYFLFPFSYRWSR